MDEKLTPEEIRRQQMLTQPVEKLVCTLAVPTIITMLITAVYNSADTYFVGRISTVATASVGLALPLMNMIQAVGFFFGQGSGNFMAHEMGKGNLDTAKKMADTALIFSFLFGGLITLLGTVLLSGLIHLLGATPLLEESSAKYMSVLLLGAPFMTASFTLNNQFRFQGEAKRGTVGMGAGSILNIVLDPVLMFGLNLGVAGAAWATIISQALSFGLLMGMSGRLRRWKPRFTLNGTIVGAIFQYGTPSIFRQGIMSVASICMNNVAGAYSEAVIAAVSVVQRIGMIGCNVVIGFDQGFQPVCGYNHGAGRMDRVSALLRFTLRVTTAFSVAYGVIMFSFAGPLVEFFRDDPEVIAPGIIIARYQAVTFTMLGMTMLTNMLMQNMGRTAVATFLAIARQGVFFIPALYILSGLFGVEGVYITQAAADTLTALVSAPILIHEMRKLTALERG